MASSEEGEETPSRGNEWEVVSLTASTFAAAPGQTQVDVNDEMSPGTVGTEEAETSHAMFMSRHFVFPPNQHENLPFELPSHEIHTDEGIEHFATQFAEKEYGKSDMKDQENLGIKELNLSEEFPGIPIFDEKGNILAVSGTEFGEGTVVHGLNLVHKEQGFYSSSTFSSFHSQTHMGASTAVDEDVSIAAIDPSDRSSDSVLPNIAKSADKSKHNGCSLPCEAWWKRRAASLVAHAKEANTFWSLFIAAAVMGLVILGQRWQQERWQILQLKWQFSSSDERMGRMLGPISRLKDVIVGGERRNSFIKTGSAAQR